MQRSDLLTAEHQCTTSQFTPDTNCYYCGENTSCLCHWFYSWREWFMANAPSATVCAGVIAAFSVNRAGAEAPRQVPSRHFFDVWHQSVKRLWTLWCADAPIRTHRRALSKLWTFPSRNEKEEEMFGCEFPLGLYLELAWTEKGHDYSISELYIQYTVLDANFWSFEEEWRDFKV